MAPAILPGDWILVDPTVTRWPRRGTTVIFEDLSTGGLSIKRVAARPGDWVPFADAWLQLGEDEAWLIGDATDDEVRSAYGHVTDSRSLGPIPVAELAGRAWFRYWPLHRIGRIAPAPPDLLARGRAVQLPAVAGEATTGQVRRIEADEGG